MTATFRRARPEPASHGRADRVRHDLNAGEPGVTQQLAEERPRVAVLYVACGAAALVVAVWLLWAGTTAIVRGDVRGALGGLAFLPLCIGLITATYEYFTGRGSSRTFVHLTLLLPICCLLSFLSHIV